MKTLVYCLLSSLLFLFSGCWWLEEDDCTPLPSSITVKVLINLWDVSESDLCDQQWAVDFWKVHCGAGPSNKMSYVYEGCYDDGDVIIVERQGIGTWDITFGYKEDALKIEIFNNKNESKGAMSLTGETIYSLTNQGTKAIVLNFLISGDGTVFTG